MRILCRLRSPRRYSSSEYEAMVAERDNARQQMLSLGALLADAEQQRNARDALRPDALFSQHGAGAFAGAKGGAVVNLDIIKAQEDQP